MRNLKRKLLLAAAVLAFTAGTSALGSTASAAILSAGEPSGPISNVGRDYRISLMEADRAGGHVIHRAVNAEKQAAADTAPEAKPDTSDITPNALEDRGPGMRRNGPPDRQYRQQDRDDRPAQGPGMHRQAPVEDGEYNGHHARHHGEGPEFHRDGREGDPSNCPGDDGFRNGPHHRDFRYGRHGERRHHGEWKGGDSSEIHDRNGRIHRDRGDETPPPPPPQDAQF